MTKITIATSIAPRNFGLQRAAIDSWLQLGFKVISLNSSEEAAIVSTKFPDIHLKVAQRSAETITGKHHVFLDDIFTALSDEQTDICGIVNSDIHLTSRDDIQKFIQQNAANSFIFGGRIDIESLDNFNGEEYFGGFDFFFFDKSLISLYPKTDFCIGIPWWDYWIPLVPIIKGIPVKQLISPFAYHLNHPTKWSQNLFEHFGLLFAKHILQEDSNRVLERPLHEAAENSKKQTEGVGPLDFLTLYYLKRKSEKISYVSAVDSEKKVDLTVREYTEWKEKLTFYQTQFHQILKLLEEREELSEKKLKSLQESLQ